MYTEWARALSTGKSDLLTTGEEGLRVTEIARKGTERAMQQKYNRPR